MSAQMYCPICKRTWSINTNETHCDNHDPPVKLAVWSGALIYNWDKK